MAADGNAGSNRDALVELRGVSKDYRQGARLVPVLRRLDLRLERGEFAALMGPSGSGKSTLLNLVGGLDRPSSGELRVGGVAIDRLSRRQLADWRAARVGFVFQFYNLIPVLSAAHNVELPLSLLGVGAAERRRRVEAALALVGLEARAAHRPAQLSGGEQQRVAIARAIVAGPELLLCDEPTGDLDRATGEEIMQLLVALNREHGKTILLITHDARAAAHAGRRIELDKGELVERCAA